ncbi:hypothetical protein AB0O91_27855 [Kitasatospora sp. NPDC089797]|uniref:hypothetical protein n=1 Tax=Kitasatospora sp. NPDC089797 TaxID=3155298 RepID=UPI003422295E
MSSLNVPPAEQSTGSLLKCEVNGTTTRSPPGRITGVCGPSRSCGASSATRASARATFPAGTKTS